MSSSNPNDPTVMPNEYRNATKYYDVSALQELSAFSSGYVLGENFRLEKILGRGGMGEAWKAYDQTADRFVVLKFIPKEIQHVQEAMDLLRSSFKKVHALQHQHICPVYGLFTDHQHGLYLAMKYIDGVSLDVYRRKYVKKHGKLLFSDIVQILWGVAKGLDYAHEKKVVHRDIKPQNIMIGQSDGVQIIDFGLAEDIRTSLAHFSREPQMSVAGTRPYMAPEQWRGRLQDAQTDQYAFAVTAYEIFSGHVPFLGNDIAVLRESVLNEEPEPIAELPEYVNNALLKALSKKQEDRYENCKAFIKSMITKPQESENAETTANEILPDEANIEQNNRWLPSTIFVSSETSSVVQKTGIQIKKIKPFWLVLTVIYVMIIVLGVGLFLMQKMRRPTVESVAEPVNVESFVAKPPKIEQNIIEQKQPIDDPPKENIIIETKNEQPTVNKTNEKELLKVTEFKNGYLPEQNYWSWLTDSEDQVTLTNNMDRLVVNFKKRGKSQYFPSLNAQGFSFRKSMNYVLTFEVKANKPTKIETIASRIRPPLHGLGLEKEFDIDTNWKTFTVSFEATQDEPHARIIFTKFQEGNIYEFRRVSLCEINTMSSVAEILETKQEIIGQKQPVDNPPKENVIEKRTKNDQPTINKTSEKELLKVTEFKSGYLPKKDHLPGHCWIWLTDLEDQVTLTNNMDRLVVNFKKRGKNIYRPMLFAQELSLRKSMNYVLTFEIKADKPTKIRMVVGMNHHPWRGLGPEKEFDIDTNWKTLTVSFEATQDEPNARIMFAKFQEGSTYEFRRVSLCERNTISSTVKLPETKQEIIEQKQPVTKTEQQITNPEPTPIKTTLNTLSPKEKAEGFQLLFDGKQLSPNIWQSAINGYPIEDEAIVCRKGGNLLTVKEYSNFVLRFEFLLPPGGNNGVGIRAESPKEDAAYYGMEIQILDNSAKKYKEFKPYRFHGSIYGVVPAKRNIEKNDYQKPVGEWNVQEITASGSKIKVVLNGETILDTDIAMFKNKPTPDGKTHPGLHREKGFLGFLGHDDPVRFRNIRVKELKK
ncbi:MAG: DUF1080 domain-containing protein [Planctomycetaceae bacterium]|jgi:serine/threonine protein kinase|nr:DUF1080 domain-containing protein [Planctomycetaceae bacterium]